MADRLAEIKARLNAVLETMAEVQRVSTMPVYVPGTLPKAHAAWDRALDILLRTVEDDMVWLIAQLEETEYERDVVQHLYAELTETE